MMERERGGREKKNKILNQFVSARALAARGYADPKSLTLPIATAPDQFIVSLPSVNGAQLVFREPELVY